MANHIRWNLLPSAEHQRIVIPKIPNIGDPPHQGLDDDRKCARPGRLEDFAEISRRDENNLRQRIMEPFDFAVINGLHLPPQLADLLLLIVAGQDFAESLERNDLGRQFIAAQTLPHLRAERRPVVGTDVRCKTRRDQRAHGCEHGLAAIHAHSARRSGSCALPGRWRWASRCCWGLHLCRYGGLRLSCRGRRYCQAQCHQHDLLLKFFHAFRRSPHSGLSLFLSPRFAVLRTEGHIWEQSMSSHSSTAYCQSTSPYKLRQGIPSCSANTS